MPILAKFTKQPDEVQDYDISFVDWLAGFSDTDTGQSVIATADPGIVIEAAVLLAGVAKVWLSGGTDKGNYKITVTLTTLGGRVKQIEFVIKVRES